MSEETCVTKMCACCKTLKPFSDFTPSGQKDKVGAGWSYCRGCRTLKRKKQWSERKDVIREQNRASHAKTRYGLTRQMVAEMLAKQGGVCAICGTDKPYRRTREGAAFTVDHDHRTGKIRGLLCQPCNAVLGIMQEDAQRMRRMADYIDSFNNPLG